MFKYLRPAFIITFGAILLLGNSLSAQQPQGKIISLDYKSDKHHSLYPGTERNIKVYVPEQYDGSKPACLYVGLDGILCNAPKVFDKLIAEGKMPVTIGIFVQPGVVYAKNKAKATAEAYNSAKKVIRYNRSNEFDYTDGRFAEFLNNEIIPFVERKAVIEGKDIKIKISDNPNDRSIFGLSSGGIAAFNAAWFHPELFRRVFSGVGTFVSMRGGNDLQMLVRKCEPKPLRIFLQDGSNDVWNATFGHWYEANQMLSTALDFAGYDTRYDWSDGGHSVKRAAEIFEDVMIWLWADYPAPIKAGITKNDFLNKYIYKDEKSEPYGNLSDNIKDKWKVKFIDIEIKGNRLPGVEEGDPSSSSFLRLPYGKNEEDIVFGINYKVNYPDSSFTVYSLPDLGFSGWKAFDDTKNRYAIINDYLDGAMEPFRQMQYTYYRSGLDQMSENTEQARNTIAESLNQLKEAREAKSLSSLPQIFTDYKSDELVSIFSGQGSAKESESIYDILFSINPSQNTYWEKIKQ